MLTVRFDVLCSGFLDGILALDLSTEWDLDNLLIKTNISYLL